MQVAAWLSHIKTENIAYPACTLQYNGKQCSKKVQDSGGGQGDMQVIQFLPPAGILVCPVSNPDSKLHAGSARVCHPQSPRPTASCSAHLILRALSDCPMP